MRLNLAEVNEHIENMNKPRTEFKSIYSFSLKDNHDGAHAYILQEDASKSYFYRTHTVWLTSRAGKKYPVEVDCLGNDCPLCQEAMLHKGEYPTEVSFAKDNIFIPLYVIDKRDGTGTQDVGELNIWKRGSKYYSTDLAPHSARYAPLYKEATEIERVGAKGSKETSYRLFNSNTDFAGNPIEKVGDLEELKAKCEFTDETIYGAEDSLIKIWTKEQMIEAINTKKFPTGNNVTNEETSISEDDIPFKESTENVTPRNRTSVRRASEDYGF